jgi:hypothetical protein
MRPISPPRPTRSGSTRLAALVRWLHIYLSMFGFATLIFFSLTGITLNHPDWLLGTAKRESQVEGQMNSEWLKPSAAASTSTTDSPAADPAQQLARLEIVEFLRHEHLVRGAVSTLPPTSSNAWWRSRALAIPPPPSSTATAAATT